MSKYLISFSLVFALLTSAKAQNVVEDFDVWPDSSRFLIENGSVGNEMQIQLAADTVAEGTGALRCAWRVQANSFAGIWTRLSILNPAASAIADFSQFTHISLAYYNSIPSSAPSRVAFQLTLIEASDVEQTTADPTQYEQWVSSHTILDESAGWKQLDVSFLPVDIGSRETTVWRQSSTGISGNGKLDLNKIRGIVLNFAGSVSLLNNEKSASGVIFLDGLKLTGEANGSPDDAVEIVILGSSTAEGAGPADWNNAWVNRYRTFLKSENDFNQVHNLALGGYTTYHILPTGYASPSGRPTVDTERNITRALNLKPDAIIINLPTNDAAYGYAAAEQMANYATVNSISAAAEVPVWITTPQGRNMNEDLRLTLISVRDSTNSRYGENAIDFFSDLALDDATVNPIYDAGDGIHLNDAGHEVLFTRVRDANIPAHLSTSVYKNESNQADAIVLSNFPNPFGSTTQINYSISKNQNVDLRIFDLRGRIVAIISDGWQQAGAHSSSFAADDLSSGVYFMVLKAGGQIKSQKMLIVH